MIYVAILQSPCGTPHLMMQSRLGIPMGKTLLAVSLALMLK